MASRSTPITAVVADDEADVRQLITEYLVARGVTVTPAADGIEALSCVQRVRPDVVVLDLMMPRLGGVDALTHIRRHSPNVAVIVMTGAPDDALVGRAMSLGAAALLPKPVNLELLGSMVSAVTGTALARRQTVAEARPASPASPTGLRVMVVDDDEGVQDLLREFLEMRGYKPLLARDGLTALMSTMEDPPDVVLLDVHMPRMGGIEALTVIRAIAPGTQVIMISGDGDAATATRALSHGAFDYVKKPLDLESVDRSIQSAVKAGRRAPTS